MQNITTFEEFKSTAKDGMKIKCKIEGAPIQGKITIEDGEIFICQNKKDGRGCINKKGYKYSWVADSFSTELSNVFLEGVEKENFVVYVSGGKTPHKKHTLENAKKEAKRVAGIEKRKTFVYELKAIYDIEIIETLI